MKRPLRLILPACALTVALLTAAAPAHASSAHAAPPGSTPGLIERAAGAKRLSRDTATLYLAYALHRPAKLPRAYRSDVPWDGTLPLLHLRAAVQRMRSGPQRTEAAALVAAASSGTCSSSSGSMANALESDDFHMDYNTIGGGLTAAQYLASLDQAWAAEVTSFGWAAPPKAAALGNRYHVRVDSLSGGLYGYVSSSGTYAGQVGDNPNTAWNEGDAYASCMVLNRDYSGFPSSPQASLDSTTAHEFNHSIQFGYGALSGANTPDDAFIEGGATWMEDEVQNGANDNYNYLWPVFGDSMGQYGASPYPYWIAFRGLTERYGAGVAGGAEDVMQDFWEETSQGTGNNLTAMQTALSNQGTTLADAFHAYAIAVKFNHACSGGWAYPYCFAEGPNYVAEQGATAVHHTISSVGGSTPTSGRNPARLEDNYAINWVALPASGSPYLVRLENLDSGGQLRGTAVCPTATGPSITPLPATVGPNSNTALSGYNPSGIGCTGTPVLVLTNQSQTAANPGTSTTQDYRVSTSGAPVTQFQLTASTTGSGSISSSPAGISCGADCTQPYDSGTVVALTATPSSGWSFAGWGGDCSDTGPCSVTMSQASSVSATFTQDPAPSTFAVTVSRTDDGSGEEASSPGGIACGADCSESYPQGTTVTLTAAPTSGSSFTGWSGGGCSGTGTCVVSSTSSVTADFAALPPSGGGTNPPPGGTTTPTTTTSPITSPVGATSIDPAPNLTLLRTSPARWRIGRGSTLAYSLSEAARVVFRVERAVTGRRVGGRCARTTALNRAQVRCLRWVRLPGGFAQSGRRGANSKRFSGRLAGRLLAAGRYRFVALYTDAAGQAGVARRAGFTVIR